MLRGAIEKKQAPGDHEPQFNEEYFALNSNRLYKGGDPKMLLFPLYINNFNQDFKIFTFFLPSYNPFKCTSNVINNDLINMIRVKNCIEFKLFSLSLILNQI